MMAIRGDTHTYKISSTIVLCRQKLSSSQLQNKGVLASLNVSCFYLTGKCVWCLLYCGNSTARAVSSPSWFQDGVLLGSIPDQI